MKYNAELNRWISKEDHKLYEREYCWYKSHGHCRWEEE